jgi:hypothetical protein
LVTSLQTPDDIRRLQRKLYLKAKAEPNVRFYLLYDKIYREDILRHAYDLARANKGAPGVDGATFGMIEAEGLEEWLSAIRQDLIKKTYRPAPVRRVMILKPGGNGERPLGIPKGLNSCWLKCRRKEGWSRPAAAPTVQYSLGKRTVSSVNQSVISGMGKSVNSSAFSNTLLPLPSSQVRMPVCFDKSAFSTHT